MAEKRLPAEFLELRHEVTAPKKMYTKLRQDLVAVSMHANPEWVLPFGGLETKLGASTTNVHET